MKNRTVLLTAAVFLGMISGLRAQNVPSYVPTNGLVGWWPFNGNANDESGNGNNGTVNGATLTTDRFGNVSKAFEFDGQQSFIQVNHSNSLNTFPISVFSWIKAKKTNGGRGIVCKYPFSGAGNGWSLHGNLGYLSGYYYNFPGGSDINFDSNFGNQELLIDTNSWHLVGIVCDVDSSKLYIDNNLIITRAYSGSGSQSNCTNSDNLYFGQIHLNNITNFHGSIDDISIYNRALIKQEISALYHGGNSNANCLDLPNNLQQGLVGYWPFCGNAMDESGNGNHGTVDGATLTEDRFGNAGKAYRFDGINDEIYVVHSDSLNLLPITISVWFKTPPNQPLNKMLVNKYGCQTNNGYSFNLNGNKPGAYYFSNGGQSNYLNLDLINGNPAYEEISDFQWHHGLVIFRTDSVKIFIDNLLVLKEPPSNGQLLVTNTLENLHFGRYAQGVCDLNQNYFFDGILDDIAIWNRALTPQEITQLYNQGICKTSITVTDTLLIHTSITSYNPVACQNTLKVWPNPGNQDIIIDAGNLALMQGWKIRVSNAQGVQIYPSGSQSGLINQQQQTLDMSGWGGNGLYFLYLIDPQNNIQEVKKIVLAP